MSSKDFQTSSYSITFGGSGLYGGSSSDYVSTSDFINSLNQDFWEEDGISMTGNPNPSNDTLSFSSSNNNYYGENKFNLNTTTSYKMNSDINKNGFWKYEEDKTLKELEQYLSSTYHSHYTSEASKTQTLDLIESIGDAEAFTRSNAIKYLSRFGKKNGKSKLDILKAMHYCILLYHFAGLHKNTTDRYETF